MTKEEIGFKHGIPESRDRTWEKQIARQALIFSKKWESKDKHFLYGCHTKAGNGNTFYDRSNLDIEDLAGDRRFALIRSISASGVEG